MGEMELKEAMSDDVRLQTSLPKVTVTATTLITIKNRCNFSHLPRFPSRWYGVLLFTFPPWLRVDQKKLNRLSAAAELWLELERERGADLSGRIDVIGVCEGKVVEHFEDVAGKSTFPSL